ncbi:type II secretion system F family protein [Paenibacillus sp. WLX1005]|uniref:type II secretion system F family protein n=1 Tax=Paenibacillus sp. WLX1005 TaxID=3243766 RepID=UPI0039845C9F
MIETLLFMAAVLLCIFSIYYYLSYRADKRTWKRQMETRYQKTEKRRSFIMVMGDRFDRSQYAEPVRLRLVRANVPLNPSEFLAILIVGTMAAVFVFSNFFSMTFPLNVVLAVVLVAAAQYVFFLLRQGKQQERMNEQLPEVCRILANTTRSGMTLAQGMGMVAQEIAEPARSEFQRIVSEMSLGIDFERALRNMEKRLPSREYKLFVAMLLVQKRAGGNLYSILSDMSTTLEERKILRQEIRTMTAEQRYVAYILPVIPIFLILMMNSIVDGFLDPLFTPVGMILGVVFVIGIGVTILLVRKVTNIRV